MTKTSLSILFAIILSTTFAQKGKVTSALSEKEAGRLDQALTLIEEAVNPANPKSESSIAWPHTWEVRGEIYQAIYKSKDEKSKKLNADPLLEALKSYQKAIELDEKGKFTNSLKIKMQLLINDLSEQAVNSFNELNFNKALASFEQVLAIQDNPVYQEASSNVVDTAIVFNAGLAAFKAEQYDKAIEFYKKAAQYKYSGSRTYELLALSYLAKTDTMGALAAMQEGLQEYQDNSSLLDQVIDIYIKLNIIDDAMKYLDMAITRKANNEILHLVRGNLFVKLNKNEEAVKCYEKAIALKPDFMVAYFNLGNVYYNRGVKQTELANEIPSSELQKYEQEKAKADMEFKTALPYLEKAYEINDTDRMTLESLKNVYYRLQMLDKHASVVEKMKSIE
ncbi:MAG TPA: tetratricopeptide repeat protein [Prolixibacteraceae bacterium]|nr:tetratricopeptide repeat protein [Prolixibacteraceae bacterium]